MKEEKRKEITKLLQEYRQEENTQFKDIKPKLLNLIGELNCFDLIKHVFIENMLIFKENNWDKSQIEIRDIYDSYRILNMVEEEQELNKKRTKTEQKLNEK